ncbi:T9SS type A sorting domain-containing protein [Sediminitomix flava]|uniref:T9SS type A sorting domain-containing protein n=1 Tax=Sediminitomix flava TaxID=379075 RepID=UPI000D6CCEC4
MIYPNPFIDEFKINLESIKDEQVRVEIYDAIGKKVLERHYVRPNQLLVLGQEIKLSGTYYIRLTTENHNGVYKLIKR